MPIEARSGSLDKARPQKVFVAGPENLTGSALLDSRPEHLAYLDMFRGYAILQIVMLHAANALLQRGLSHPHGDIALVQAVFHILFHDATIYFTMISGILYAHLFWKRAHLRFLRQRFYSTGIPYVIVTIALTASMAFAGWLHQPSPIDPAAFIRTVLVNIATGAAWNTLWYIPVIIALYFVSPLLIALVHNRRWQWISLIILALPLLVSRTGTELTPAMVGYFAGAYMAGLMIGSDLDRGLDFLASKKGFLWALVMGATMALAILYALAIDQIGSVSLRESAFYIQRLALASLTLTYLRNRITGDHSATDRWIRLAAVMSFGIYFVHGPLLRIVARAVGMFVPKDQPWWAIMAAIVATFVVGLLLSFAVVEVVRRVAGKRSRVVIGVD